MYNLYNILLWVINVKNSLLIFRNLFFPNPIFLKEIMLVKYKNFRCKWKCRLEQQQTCTLIEYNIRTLYNLFTKISNLLTTNNTYCTCTVFPLDFIIICVYFGKLASYFIYKLKLSLNYRVITLAVTFVMNTKQFYYIILTYVIVMTSQM